MKKARIVLTIASAGGAAALLVASASCQGDAPFRSRPDFEITCERGLPFEDGVLLPYAFSHSGANAGYRCYMFGYLNASFGMALMTNSDTGDQITQQLVDAVLAAY